MLLMLIEGYLFTDSTAQRDMADIAGCVPLVMSWIYHRFLTFCHAEYDILRFSLALRLVELEQQTRDHQHNRDLRLWHKLDALRFNEMTPDWIRNAREIHIWRSMVPLVCFHFVEFHRVDRINRQLGGQQHRLEGPVNVDEFLFRMTRGDDVWWPERYYVWYDMWREHGHQHRMATIESDPDPRPTKDYLWWQGACLGMRYWPLLKSTAT
ncbi:hypothetical protein AHAS_Ahas04G0180700 [Arachis hypogaea]